MNQRPEAMSFKLIATVQKFEKAGYIAWIDSIKGMVVYADTADQAWKELMISLKVKIAYDLGIKETKDLDRNVKEFTGEGQEEINLTLA